MADIEVVGPDGSTVAFPEGTDHATIQAAMQKHFGGPKSGPDHDTTTGSLAKAAGKGAVSGLVGTPGDIEHLAHAGIAWWKDRETAPNLLPTSSDVDQYMGYDPNTATTAEKYAHGAGQFAGGAAIGGPAGIARRAALGAVSGLASEAAGQATQGTAAEPYARVAGALITPSLAGRTSNLVNNVVGRRVAAANGARMAAPTVDELKAAGGAGNDAFRASGATVDPNELAKFAQDQRFRLDQQGYDPLDHGPAYNVLNRMDQAGQQAPVGAPQMSSWMQNLRRQGEATQDFRPTQGASAARDISRNFEDWLNQQAGSNPTLRDALDTRAEGNANYAGYIRGNDINNAMEQAELNAARQNSGANLGNALRAQAQKLYNRGGWSPEEEAQLQTIIRGTMASNLTRRLSNILGGGGGIGHSGMAFAAHAAINPIAGLGVFLGGPALRGMSNNMVLNQFKRLGDLSARRTPLGRNTWQDAGYQGQGVLGPAMQTLQAMSSGQQ